MVSTQQHVMFRLLGMLIANVGTNLSDVDLSAESYSLVKLQSTGKDNVKIPCAGLGCVQIMTTNLDVELTANSMQDLPSTIKVSS